MADWSSLNGQRVVSANISIPYYGAWVADVVLSVSTAIPTGLVTLVFADVTLIGTVYRQFSFTGARSARIVGGYAGWQKTVGPRAYQSAGGVNVSTVLGDLAIDCGEQFGAVSTNAIRGQTIAAAFVRESAPALRTLKQIGGPIWWIDSTGATQIVDRAGLPYSGSTTDSAHLGAIASQFNALEYSGGKGKFSIAAEQLSDWMPGRTFTSSTVTVSQTISHVTHVFDGEGKARTSVLSV